MAKATQGKSGRVKAEDTGLSRSEIMDVIDEWIFSARDRSIMYMRWLDGMKYEDIADEMELSVCQIKKIVYRCEDRLSKHI